MRIAGLVCQGYRHGPCSGEHATLGCQSSRVLGGNCLLDSVQKAREVLHGRGRVCGLWCCVLPGWSEAGPRPLVIGTVVAGFHDLRALTRVRRSFFGFLVRHIIPLDPCVRFDLIDVCDSSVFSPRKEGVQYILEEDVVLALPQGPGGVQDPADHVDGAQAVRVYVDGLPQLCCIWVDEGLVNGSELGSVDSVGAALYVWVNLQGYLVFCDVDCCPD